MGIGKKNSPSINKDHPTADRGVQRDFSLLVWSDVGLFKSFLFSFNYGLKEKRKLIEFFKYE